MPLITPQQAITSIPRRAALFGESTVSNNLGIHAGYYQWLQIGFFTWYQRLTGYPLHLDPSLVVAGSWTTADMLTNFPTLLSNTKNFDVVFFFPGNNDISSGSPSPAVCLANSKTIVTTLLNAGKMVVLMTSNPWTGASATQLKQVLWINRSLKEWATTLYGLAPLIVVDCWNDLADPTSASSAWVTSLTSDGGVDPNTAGAYLMGKRLQSVLSPIIPPYPNGIVSAADIYDATNNPRGNLLANPGFNTATGGSQDANIGGTLVGSWTSYRINGSFGTGDVVGSSDTYAAGFGTLPGKRQIWTCVIPSGQANNSQFIMQINPTNITAGDIIYSRCNIDLSNVSKLTSIQLMTVDQVNTLIASDGGNLGTWGEFYPENCSFTLQTPPLTTGAGSGAVNGCVIKLLFQFNPTGGNATATIKIGAVETRKLP